MTAARDLARQIVSDLFSNAYGENADGLRMVTRHGLDLGQWTRQQVEDRLAVLLSEVFVERETQQCAADFLAGYHAHFDKDSAIAHERGEHNLGPKTPRRWLFSGNVVAGDMADEALDAYLAQRKAR